MAWLQKIPKTSGNWYICIWLKAKKPKKIISTGSKNKKLAEKILKRAIELEQFRKSEEKILQLISEDILYERGLSKDIQELQGIAQDLTIKSAGEAFIKSRSLQVSNSTIKSYQLALRNLYAALGKTNRLIDLSKSDYDVFLEYLKRRFVVSTTNIRQRSIKAFFNWCIEYGHLKKMPFRFRMLKIDQLPKFLRPEEVAGVYRQLNDPILVSIFKIYENTGIRLSELCSSQLEGGFLRVKGKGGKIRFIPLEKAKISDYQIALAANFKTDRISKAFCLAWRKSLIAQNPDLLADKNLNDLSAKEIRDLTFTILETEYKIRNGLESLNKAQKREAHSDGKTLHSFRHSFAVKMWAETGDIYKTKELLGHTNVATTERYARFPPEFLKEILG